MIVSLSRVYSRNVFSDIGQSIKNLFGGRLKAYEKMMNFAVSKTIEEFSLLYPNVKGVRIDTEHFADRAIAITIYGVIEDA